MTSLLPIPDEEGIRKTKEFYLTRYGKEMTDEQAVDILGRVMRLFYFASNPPEAIEALKNVIPVDEFGNRINRELYD